MKKYLLLIAFTILFFNIKNSYSQLVWNQSCSFAGTTSSYVAIPHSTTLDITASFTIEMWIKPVNSTSPTTQTLLQKRFGSANSGYTLYLSNGKVAIRTNTSTRLIGKTVLPNNQWTHIAGTFNATSDLFRIYVNGIEDTNHAVVTAEPTTNTDSVLIGNGFNGPFNGTLDEVRIWNASLSSTEVQELMRISLGTSSGVYSSLKMSLTFQNSNPVSPFSLVDWTGNNNNGINRGVSAVSMSNNPGNTISLNECVSLGSNNYLAGPDHSNVSPVSGITIEAWVYPLSFADPNTFYTIVHKGNAVGTVTDYNMSINLRKMKFKINETTVLELSTSGQFFPLNKWTHFAMSYSGATGFVQLILNGEIKWDDTSFVGNIHDNTDSLYVGGTNALACFNGMIDEVRITGAVLQYSHIANKVFTSVNENNDPTTANVVYNFDGLLVSNTDAGPRLFFRGNADFVHNAFFNNSPVSPMSNINSAALGDGFYLSSPDFRIPASGTSGFMVSDTLDILANESITDVNVFVALNHTDEDNLVLSLISPTGINTTLYSTTSLIGNSDNIITVFDDQADSSLVSNRYVMFTPKIKPFANLNSALSGSNTLGRWRLQIQDVAANDTGILIGWGIQFNNETKRKSVLSLKALIQGFYDSTTNLMHPDTIRAYMRDGDSPFAILDSAKGLLSDSGKASLTFTNVTDGVPVYIQLIHRNALETWSKKPSSSTFKILFSTHFLPGTSVLKYDFTSTTSSAFGNNEIKVDASPNKFALYSGDVTHDGTIDISDIIMIFNDANNFVTGYVVSDVTGDNATDLSDLIVTFNNSLNFVSLIRP